MIRVTLDLFTCLNPRDMRLHYHGSDVSNTSSTRVLMIARVQYIPSLPQHIRNVVLICRILLLGFLAMQRRVTDKVDLHGGSKEHGDPRNVQRERTGVGKATYHIA